MDWTEMITTLSACWGIIAVAGLGIVALPWSSDELGATRGALSWGAGAVARAVGAASGAQPVAALAEVVVLDHHR